MTESLYSGQAGSNRALAKLTCSRKPEKYSHYVWATTHMVFQRLGIVLFCLTPPWRFASFDLPPRSGARSKVQMKEDQTIESQTLADTTSASVLLRAVLVCLLLKAENDWEESSTKP